jgi:imidazolonepropionase-like amidohydrolase
MALFRIISLALMALFGQPDSQRAVATDALALTGAKIYLSPDAEAISDGVIVIRDGKIVSVGPRVKMAVPAGVKALDCAGMVIVAGYQNSHVHFTEDKWNGAAQLSAARLSAQLLAMFSIYGFTTVVDTGSTYENTNALRARIESGEVVGPRIIATVTTLFPPDGLPIYLQELRKATGWVPDEPATPEAAAAVVRRSPGKPQDILKLFTGSLVTYDNVKPMPVDVARAAVDEAHRAGRLVWAHPSNIAGVQIAVDTGVDVLAHTTSVPGAWSRELINSVVRAKMALVPTLKLWRYVTENSPDPAVGTRMVEGGVAQVREFSRAGGEIMFGTDVGFMHDYDPTDECSFLGRAVTPMQILASLTTVPAARFKEQDRRGRIAPGMDADVVVLGSDPAQDVRNFTDVRYTIRKGRIIFSYPTSSTIR